MLKFLAMFLIELIPVLLVGAPLCYWLNAPWYATFSIFAIVMALISIALDVRAIRNNLKA